MANPHRDMGFRGGILRPSPDGQPDTGNRLLLSFQPPEDMKETRKITFTPRAGVPFPVL